MAFSGRREDHRLLTGQGRYTADWSLPGQLRGAFLRSDVGHAAIRGIDIAEALAAPGVRAVLTGQDALDAGFRRVPPHLPVKGRDGGPIKAPLKPVLALDRVRYVGEPVALVVAETEAQAKDAAELIAVDYDHLQAISDPADALAEEAPLVHDDVPGNLALDFPFGDAAAVEVAFAAAAHVVRLDLDSARVSANPMEPKACLVRWEGEVMDMWCPSQGMTGLSGRMAAATGLPESALRFHAIDVGGAFGVRGDVYPEYMALALAAKRLGRPVKWVAGRMETFVSDMMGRGIRMRGELALDTEGRFLAIRHDWIADLGAHVAPGGSFTPVMNISVMATGAYRIPAACGRTRLAMTNRVPVTAYRGAARPEAAYVVERLVDEAARVSGIDRVELRRRNMLPPEAFPYKLTVAALPGAYDSADFPRMLRTALSASDWAGFEDRRAEAKGRGRLRGIGCAVFIEPAGGVAPVDEVSIAFAEDGSIVLHQVAQASGQGYETVFPEIVGRALGIDPARITLAPAGPDAPAKRGGGAFGSRSLMSQGSVFDAASEQVVAKGRVLAATALGVAEADLDYADGSYQARGSNRFIALDELARANPGALDTIAELASPKAFPSGAHVAEVEIDPETGVVDLVNYISVDDCGTVINETLVKGQVLGGLYQGLGQVLGEVCAYDADGQLLSASFMDYMMPRADLTGPVAILMEPTPSPGNRLGAKGVGESGTVGALPTAMNAILDALAPAGVRHLDMPATPRRVWEALQAARG